MILEIKHPYLRKEKLHIKIETFWSHWKSKKNSFPEETNQWDLAKLYIQCITKDLCVDFMQKQIQLLAHYRAEINSLYEQRFIVQEKIEEIQNEIEKGFLNRAFSKFIENEEKPL